MKNTILNNLRRWDKWHAWSRDGDEWAGQARLCDQSYDAWKESLVSTFILPNIDSDSTVLEIAPGHGRWTAEFVDKCRRIILIDLSPNCIEYCRERFSKHAHIDYRVTDGTTLPDVADACVDLIWSFDSFVHMEREVIGAYFEEARRTLKQGGKMIIHHAGRRHDRLELGFLSRFGIVGRYIYKHLSMESYPGKWRDHDGWRSDISTTVISELAQEAGLKIDSHDRFWGEQREYGVPRYGDYITTLVKPHAHEER